MVIRAKRRSLIEYFKATKKAIRASIWRRIKFVREQGYSKVTVHYGRSY
jgi:hypothetical protein